MFVVPWEPLRGLAGNHCAVACPDHGVPRVNSRRFDLNEVWDVKINTGIPERGSRPGKSWEVEFSGVAGGWPLRTHGALLPAGVTAPPASHQMFPGSPRLWRPGSVWFLRTKS